MDGSLNRFAAIADIHGNRWALEAVLEDLDRRGLKDVVNLGDHLWGPLDPLGTADLLMGLNFTSVSGNQDREEQPVTGAQRAWLDSLGFVLQFPGMLLFHGTPASDTTYLLEMVHPDGVSLARAEEVEEKLGGVDQPLLLCGHTHIPRVVQIGRQLIVNPGSVGLQAYSDDAPFLHVMETGSPHARYAVLERNGGGWQVEQIVLRYDWEAAATCAERNGRTDWAYRLRTGRAR